ncbi:MAG: DUF3810 family protein [Clostridia bacterium]
MKKRTWIACIVPAALALLCTLLPQRMLSQRVALPYQAFMGSLTAHTNVPVGEVIYLALGALVLLLPLRAGFLCLRDRSWLPARRLIGQALCALCVGMLAITLLWSPIARTKTLPAPLPSRLPRALYDLCDHLMAQAESLSGSMDDSALTSDQLIDAAQDAMAALTGRAPVVKAARYPELLGKLGLAGVCFPLTGEAIVRGDLARVLLPFVAAHEGAHQLGYGSEAEANLIAYRALQLGKQPLRYAGAMFALYYAMDALKDVDPAAYAERTSALSQRVLSDFDRLIRFQRAATGLRAGVLDAFLRLNGQSGRTAYGLMIDYLLEADAP